MGDNYRYIPVEKKKGASIYDAMKYWNIPMTRVDPEPETVWDTKTGKITWKYPSFEEYQKPDFLGAMRSKYLKYNLKKDKLESVPGIKALMLPYQAENQRRAKKLLDKDIEGFHKRTHNRFNNIILRWKDHYDRYNKKNFKTNEKIPAGLVKAIIQAESSFNPDAVGPDKDAGLMQLLPESQAELIKVHGHKFNFGNLNPKAPSIFDPEVNIRAGIRWLSRKRFAPKNRRIVEKGKTQREKLRRWLELYNKWKDGKFPYADTKVLPIFDKYYNR